MVTGKVVSLHIAPKLEAPTLSVPEVRAVAGRGLEGDRKFIKDASVEASAAGRELTLIEIEALEALERDYGAKLEPGESRRNVVTRGVALNHLVGREFKVGEVTLRGVRLCEPCPHLQRVTGQEKVLPGLVHRGGLRCQILAGGVVRAGDPVEPI